MNQKVKITPAEIFLFVMQLIYFASSSEMFQSEVFDILILAGYMIAGFMAILACMEKTISFPQIVKLVFIFSLMVITVLNSAGREFVLLVLYWVVLKSANEGRIIRSFFFANITALLINAVLSAVGVYHFFTVYDNSKYVTLGFLNPNFLGICIFNIVTLMFVCNEKISVKKYAVAILTWIFCWEFVKCRSAALAIAILTTLSLLRKPLSDKKVFALGVKYSYGILAGISILLGITGISNSVLLALNGIWSGRIVAWNVYFKYKPITLLGELFYTGEFYPLDNAYLYLLFRYGVILFSVYGVANVIANRKAIQHGSYNMQIVLLTLAIYSLMEFSPMSVFNHIGLALLTTRKTEYPERERLQ